MSTVPEDRKGLEDRIAAALTVLDDKSVFRCFAKYRHPIVCALRSCVLLSEPLRFLAYWGIGRRSSPGAPERAALTFQRDWLERLGRALRLDWNLTYLLTDTHGLVNGIAPDAVRRYAASMTALFEKEGYQAHLMSDFLRGHGIPDVVAFASGLGEQHWDRLPASSVRDLERLAGLHATGRPAREAARLYYKVNIVEAALLTRAWQGSFFITYTLPKMSFILPALPTIHSYVGQNHSANRPWFVGGTDG